MAPSNESGRTRSAFALTLICAVFLIIDAQAAVTAAVGLLAGLGWAGHGGAVDTGTGGDLVPARVAGGRPYSIVIDPHSPTTLYATTECSGVLKTTDGGERWGVVNAAPLATTRLAFDPFTPGTLYGGVYNRVYESTDAGHTWSSADTAEFGNIVYALAIDPFTPRTLYAGTDGGVYKSTDGGTTWSGRTNVGAEVYTLVIDPFTRGTLYAGTPAGLFKSTDSGATWRALAGLATQITSIPIDPITAGTIYAGAFQGAQVVVWKSTDAGATWRTTGLTTRLSSANVPAIVIDPLTPGTVYVMSYSGSLQGGEVLKSTDGGTTWQAASSGLERLSSSGTLAIDPITPTTLYVGLGDPGPFPLLGGSVFKSTDGAATWQATGWVSGVICGDGVRISCAGEACDDGNTVSGDGCDANCTLTACGNGIVTAGEECDDGNLNPSDGCTNACTICGNGTVTPPEECDDGNLINGDGCDANCTRTGCGNGIVTAGEQCDDGNTVNGDGCEADCTLPRCGNGILDPGEQCDDGNTRSCDGCSATCQIESGLRCGDGIANTACGEECDDGNTVNGDGCEADCTLPRCGNGILDVGEQCDDGNTRSCDGCSATCQIEPGFRCGDGIVNATCGEECDDGNTVNGDGCDANCTLPRCGNGIVDAGEECDDGNRNPFDGCTNACTICGNGIVTPPEECDDGNRNPFDGCTNACTRCGNGVVTPPEGCDDGNLVNGDGCDADCVVPLVCGNGRIEPGEECDDGGVCIGSANAGDFCTADTQCPGGMCKTFGGDGCAANCTTESDVVFNLIPGVAQSTDLPGIVPGTSGAVIYGDFLTIPIPFSGSQTLTLGKERNGQIPVVVKAAAVHLARIALDDIACFCPRAVAAKTCGGMIFEADGVTLSPDCTPGLTAGDEVCTGKARCTFVHGPGNSASGVIGCDGLDGVNVSLTQDAGGSSGIAGAPLLALSGPGGAGSAVLFTTTALGSGIGRPCAGADPSVYGSDGEFCTDDDPQPQRGTPTTTAVTTGTVTGALLNANQQDGNDIGPFTASGAPFRCASLQRGDASGAMLASTFTELNLGATTRHAASSPKFFIGLRLGDVVLTSALVAARSAGRCVGDCNGSGDVQISEIITMVNIAVGHADISTCRTGDANSNRTIEINEIITAVNNALNACPTT